MKNDRSFAFLYSLSLKKGKFNQKRDSLISHLSLKHLSLQTAYYSRYPSAFFVPKLKGLGTRSSLNRLCSISKRRYVYREKKEQ